jgi:hypothetical protein
MKTVTLIAHNRPMYTARVISALAETLLRTPDPVFDRLIISIDPGNQETIDVCDKATEILAETGVIECHLYVNKPNSPTVDGTDAVALNEFTALSRAFDDHGSEFNLSIEDDAILMPDAALLAQWFYERHGGPTSDYTLFGMCNHRDFGRGENPGKVPNDPSYMAESAHIPSPFAWCTSAWQWPFIKASWNCKKVPPMGWDWSLSYAMRLERRKALHPILSRCENIGRDGGVHESAQTFDATQIGLVYSDGTYDGDYRIVVRIPPVELEQLDPWMMSENQSATTKARGDRWW